MRRGLGVSNRAVPRIIVQCWSPVNAGQVGLSVAHVMDGFRHASVVSGLGWNVGFCFAMEASIDYNRSFAWPPLRPWWLR
jgi:hypothetical protein